MAHSLSALLGAVHEAVTMFGYQLVTNGLTAASVVDLKFVTSFATSSQTNFKSKTTLELLSC
jgi:hypothetical protein